MMYLIKHQMTFNNILYRLRRVKPTRPEAIPCAASRCSHEKLFDGLLHYDRHQLEEYRLEVELYEQQRRREEIDNED